MIRYELDRLGWYEFEGLVQTLLKHLLGLGVESWGGSGDWGRDAYIDEPLRYPGNEVSHGPFLFQSKFVDAANAAGAKPRSAVRKAISAEVKLIRSRLPKWGKQPNHYVFLTNSPIAAEDREWAPAALREALPDVSVHVHGGSDICAWLDNAAHIARAFPQLLGLRDLEALLTQWNYKEILQRSQIAISDAQALSQVFVPTAPYSRALQTINQHKFVVLEGPPEMGKTAIARMISLGYLARGWRVVECRVPEDFLKAFDKNHPQIFIADDFFGRTEYDPSRISKWQDDLPYILRRLDSEHLFALTTRAHLLNLARSKLDIAGYEKRFPDIAEVVVDASRLTTLDKARMLYRHCKSANLAEPIRALVKAEATSIVYNAHFTPERIRRLVHDILATDTAATRTKDDLKHDIDQILVDPTRAMSASFGALPETHKWMLFSLLESDFAPPRYLSVPDKQPLADLRARFERLCPAEDRLPVERVTAELSEAFVRKSKRQFARADLDWIHPSVRDLAISELGALPKYRKTFLRVSGVEGLKLACSVGGGRAGQLSFPLLVDDDDWSLFTQRVQHMIATSPDLITAISETVETARGQPGTERNVARLEHVLFDVAIPKYLDARGPFSDWSLATAQEFLAAFSGGRQHPTFDGLVAFWMDKAAKEQEDIKSSSKVLDEVDYLIDVLKAGELLISKHKEADRASIANVMQTLIDEMTRYITDEYDYLRRRDEPLELDDQISAVTDLVDHLKVASTSVELADLIELRSNLSSLRELLEVMQDINKPPKQTSDTPVPQRQENEVPIDRLFEDL